MLALNKTKAALQGRLSHFTKNTEEHITVIDQVNARSFAHISSNYGKSAQHLSVGGITPSVTAAMARFISEGVRHWLIPLIANLEAEGVLQRSAVTSPNFSGDLQSAENTVDFWLAEKPADSKRWRRFVPQISTKGISSLEQNQSIRDHLLGVQSILSWRLIPFSCFLNSCLITSSSEFKALYLLGMPVFFMISTAAIISCGLLNSGGNMLSVSPVIKATLCLHNTVAGQSHEIPTCPATSKTTTSYRSVLLLLSAENLYSISFFSLDEMVFVFFSQPLGSMPSRSNSLRPRVFIQFPKLIPAASAAVSNCAFSSGVRRTLNIGERPAPLGLLSLNTVDMYRPINLVSNSLGLYLNTVRLKKTTPSFGITSTDRGLTTNDIISIEAAMKNHTTHPQGRNSLTPNKFTWRFLALDASTCSVIHIDATTEREARDQSPVGCVMVFAGRLPVQGVQHA